MIQQREEVLKRLSICARCRQCRMVCEIPIAKTMLPICPSGEYFRFDSYFATGRNTLAKKYLIGEIDFDPSLLKVIYSCALCGGCRPQCPIKDRDPMESTTIMRQAAVEAGLADEYYKMPSQKPVEINWPEKEQNSTVLFVGCESQSDSETVNKLADVLKKTGISFSILSGYCCGGYILRKGDVKGFERRKTENTAKFKDMGVEKIIVHDPMCYKVLKKDYALEEQGIEVVFYLELVGKALKYKSQKQTTVQKVAYHDPCYLGRFMGVFDLPRQVIEDLGGFEQIEFKRTRENAFCCGGAPDFMAEVGAATAGERIKEAEEIGADVVVTACRNCSEQLKKASERKGSGIMVKDLLTLLDESLA